ncbi:MAG: hypothetical protein HOH19_10110 [Kordiimonadaceae bacterium]|jgi:hypothetical protein|nr:hypothetical protein [Kordiimonadaceae bacterium]MBT6032918.1 hypothetical protein [Kordiimonadaceae bacterium]
MKIDQQPQNLVSLSSLLDASKQQKAEDKSTQDTRDGRLATRESERDQAIELNRQALKKIQNDIRVKSLTKLKESGDLEERENTELNLRESISNDNVQPEFKKLGQVVDIRV